MRRSGSGCTAALLMVASLHLLTTTGTWLPMDQGEYLLSAERLIHARTFTLASVGEPLPWARWARLEPQEPVRLRMHPLTPLALAPLVALDERLGFGSPGQTGLLAHMQGHVFVLAALALLGTALRVAGVSPAGTVFGVAATGLAWPAWFASRNGGPEPILMALAAAFLLGRELSATGRRSGLWIRAAVLVVLPWSHATGPLIAAALLAGEALLGLRGRGRELVVLGLALGLGQASEMLIWNWGYHGHWLTGGYAAFYRSHQMLSARPFLPGAAQHLASLLLEGPVPVVVAVLGLRSESFRGRQPLALALLLSVGLSAFFATFHQPEPTRRLAVVWPIFGFAAGAAFDTRVMSSVVARLLLAAGALLSFHWFMTLCGRHYLGPDGLFYPSVLWVRQLIESGASPYTLAPPLALAIGVALAGRRVGRVLAV